MKSLILAALILLPLSIFGDKLQPLPWQSRHGEGWAWYHDFRKQKTQPEPFKNQPVDPIQILKIEKENLERSLAKAMLEPTKKNILVYMQLQKKWVDQATFFSQLWKINILEHPEFASMTPTTQYGVQVRKEVDNNERKKLIRSIARNTKLLFFYEGKNPFSRAFSNAVSEFSKQYNWEVKAVSIDGFVLNNFPYSLQDAQIAEEMKVDIFPSLFIMEETNLKAIPVAFGMSTISQIEENISIQFGENRD